MNPNSAPNNPRLSPAQMEELIGSLIVVSLAGTIRSWNAIAVRQYGFSVEEALHASLFDIVGSDNADSERAHWQNGTSVYEAMRRHRDGAPVFVEVTATWMEHSDGEQTVLLNERDVTQFRYQREAQSLQERFRGVLDAAPDAFVLVNSLGRIALVNPEAERLFGYTSRELLGQTVELLVPERFHSAHPTHRSSYFVDSHTRPMGRGLELSARRKDGSEFVVEISLSPLVVDGQKIAIAAVRDVTSRKKTEAKFRALLEAAPDAMVIASQKGEITLVNSQTEKLFGYSRSELLGQLVEMLVPTDLRKSHPVHRERYASDPKSRPMGANLDLRGRRKDGSEFPVEISLSPVETEEGPLVIAAIRDITERIRFEEVRREIAERLRAEVEIRGVNEQLERRVADRTSELAASNQELEAFTYSVSHDLRAPLRHIDGFSKILETESAATLSPKALHYVKRIREGTQQMSRLIDDLLNLAQVGRQRIQPKPVNLDTIVKETIEELAEEYVDRNVQWNVQALGEITFDQGLLRVVLRNLLSNALKYSRGRDPSIITISRSVEDGLPLIQISDNGVGFDEQYADRLFGVFQRLHRADQFEGTGVGLATVQRIIHKHGGRIRASSRMDEGATFSFTVGAASTAPGNSAT